MRERVGGDHDVVFTCARTIWAPSEDWLQMGFLQDAASAAVPGLPGFADGVRGEGVFEFIAILIRGSERRGQEEFWKEG